jgi:hypothetical protein
MKLPNINTIVTKLVYQSDTYKNTILKSGLILHIRNILDLRYKYSTEWSLLFSTYEHGFSYKKMLSCFQNKAKPFILVCMDSNQKIFCVYFEEQLVLSLKPYGSRRIILFNEERTLRMGCNDIKIICTEDYLAFGCTEKGLFKIFIDSKLYKGEESVFGKDATKFEIKYLEIWNIIE